MAGTVEYSAMILKRPGKKYTAYDPHDLKSQTVGFRHHRYPNFASNANPILHAMGGVYAGANLGVNFGIFLPGEKNTGEIPCVYFLFKLDAGAVLHDGFTFGVGTQGYTFVEFQLGLGAGAGAGGSLCYTFACGLSLPDLPFP